MLRRVGSNFMDFIRQSDNELHNILKKEINREESTLELIASEFYK